MKVSTKEPFQVVYSLFEHEYLGFLLESFVVQLNDHGKLTFKHQNISYKNAKEFESGLSDVDYEIIKLIDEIQQENIVLKFSDKKLKVYDFFRKIYDKEKGDENLQHYIEEYIEKRKAKILSLLKGRKLYIMGKDGEPAWKYAHVCEEPASVLFHFFRNTDNTHYYPTIKHHGKKIEFQHKGAKVINNRPGWLLCEGNIYHFEKDILGNKLKPFLNKKFIEVSKKVEEKYYHKFVKPLVESFDVFAKGFEIKSEKHYPTPVVIFSELQQARSSAMMFEDNNTNENEEILENDDEGQIKIELKFQYGKYLFAKEHTNTATVEIEKTDDSYIFHKVNRHIEWEKEKFWKLQESGLSFKNGKAVMKKSEYFSWLSMYKNILEEEGYEIRQNKSDQKKYFTGTSKIDVEINENIDWFDIYTKIQFGEYEIPFYYLKELIFNNKREFTLPNGEIAVIPEVWLNRYAEIFAFINKEDTNDSLKLNKHHIALVQQLKEQKLARVSINEKLQKLKDFDHIDDYQLPENFKGELRPYQKAGYNWMHFLNQYNFGGCLADDMGLGKTIQALAMLQYQKEQGTNATSMLIVPTSLIYNWEAEAKKFTPKLKIHKYTGTYRDKNIEYFQNHDLIITSYGIIRIDQEILKNYYFNYIILDESQAIKNPSSNTFKAVKKLTAQNRLVLTGTPVENTTLDLWAQMSFINPGLLGDKNFFKEQFLNPIEKGNDQEKTDKLHTIIKPFILRRQKIQVAKELPEKIESIRYCKMTDGQEEKYEQIKSYYRNKILEQIDQKGVSKSQMLLLEGLTKLRQIANHPLMIDPEYEGNSGKMEDITYMLEEALSENHKILVFSAFVKHLSIISGYLKLNNIPYNYLDGTTKNREEQVSQFQSRDDMRVFLISLKAGGVGLNLTAADYVFILDPWWNPAIESQAIDRAHRIGQDKTVFTYKFITKESVEEKIIHLQNKKKHLAEELISKDESFVKNLSKEDIEMILT